VIGECLENISKIPGKIVSVTTDGFITNIENLESKLVGKKGIFIFKYKVLKYNLKCLTQLIRDLFMEGEFKIYLKFHDRLILILNSSAKLIEDLNTLITDFN